MTATHEHGIVALVMPLVDARLPLEVHGLGKCVLEVDLVRIFLDLNLAEVNRESRKHAQLQV